MRLPRSLFGRMLALSLGATLAALLVAGFAISGVLERFVTDGIDARLGDRLVALGSAVRADGSLDRAQLARVSERIPRNEPWLIETDTQAIAGGGHIGLIRPPPRPALASGRASPRPPRAGAGRGGEPFEGRRDDGMRVHGLVAVVSTRMGNAHVLAAVPRAEIDRPVMGALAPLAASLAILGLSLGGAALVQLRVGLRPLTTLRGAVEAIRHGRAASVPEDLPQELAPLARELNALAAETAAALAGARASAANLAHALKTPVATLSLHLDDDEIAQAQLARVDATLRHHLGRARSAAADRRAITALGAVLGDLVGTITHLHGSRSRIALNVPEGISVAIDRQDLDELAGNLLDNAARHASAAVEVSATVEGRWVRLTIADDGPGIPFVDRVRATQPGVRLDERASGHGFGLAIARELTELYGGALTLDDAQIGGLLVTVTLPLAR